MVRLIGELRPWPAKDELARLFTAQGLNIKVGQYSIRIVDFSDFTFQEYGGDLESPVIEAAASSISRMTWEARLISEILARADVPH